jgi:4-hydroxy-tetrahydrodipicolinate reductase
MLRIAVLGATGRMGITVTRAVASCEDAAVSGALVEPGNDLIGADVAEVAGLAPVGITIVDDPQSAVREADVAIDFTLPNAAISNLDACVKQGCGIVMGTTGLDDAQQQAVRQAGQAIGVLYGRNMSVGVNVLTELARRAARLLGPDWEVEISEAHHRFKVDAPSGTALQIGEAIAAERGQNLDDVACYERLGSTGPRPPDAIGFSSVRAGSLVGEHTVVLVSDTELLRLEHRALDRATFAQGALRAARWLVQQPAGVYGMADVLELGD